MYWRFLSNYSYINIWPRLWPHSTQWVHDLNKVEYYIPYDTSKHLTVFWQTGFFRIFFKYDNNLSKIISHIPFISRRSCPKVCFVPSVVELALWSLRRSWKYENTTTTTRTTTTTYNGDRQRKNFVQKSSLASAHVN